MRSWIGRMSSLAAVVMMVNVSSGVPLSARIAKAGSQNIEANPPRGGPAG